jgi:hypothetical protein
LVVAELNFSVAFENIATMYFELKEHVHIFLILPQGALYRTSLAGGERSAVLARGIIGTPYALALDWIARNLFVANIGASTLEVVRLGDGGGGSAAGGGAKDRDAEDGDGGIYRKVLLANNGTETGVARPVALAVDPIKGYVGRKGLRGHGLKEYGSKIVGQGVNGSEKSMVM